MRHYKQDPIDIWEYWFGDRSVTRDFANRLIMKDKYGVESENGWTIDHINPISNGGTDVIENIIPVHHLTNKEKGNKFPIFWTNGSKITLKKIKVFSERKGKYVEIWEIFRNNEKVI